jgi:hypothetical protein
MFDCYEVVNYPAKYYNPDRTNPMDIAMVGFVDDCIDQTNTFMRPETAETLPTTLL